MRNWFAAKWAAVKSWASRTASKVKAVAIAVLAALGLTVGVVTADDVSLTWTNATEYTDGTALPPGDLDRTFIEFQSFPLGTDLAAAERTYQPLADVPATETSYVHGNVPDGIYCYVAYHVTVDGRRSDNSNESCKTVDTRLPGAPQGLSAN